LRDSAVRVRRTVDTLAVGRLFGVLAAFMAVAMVLTAASSVYACDTELVRARARQDVPGYRLADVRSQNRIVTLLFTAPDGKGSWAVALHASGTQLSTSVTGQGLDSEELTRAAEPLSRWWQLTDVQQALVACGRPTFGENLDDLGPALHAAAEAALPDHSPRATWGTWIEVGVVLLLLVGLWQSRRIRRRREGGAERHGGLARTAQRLGLSLASLSLCLLAVEAAVRWTDLENRTVLGALVWVPGGDHLEDPFLHYVPVPLPRTRPDRPITEGSVRVLCFGGSTTWGISVPDEETFPARLEAYLNADAARAGGKARRFEVENYGVPGYTLGQAAPLARQQLAAQPPDLILVQLHNRGRRPFMGVPGQVNSYPREQAGVDVNFFLEQFPVPTWLSPAYHRFALEHSALYRSSVALSTHWVQPSGCDRCDEVNGGESESLQSEANARGVPVMYVGIPAERGGAPEPGVPAERFVDLYRPQREPEFYLVHPPARVLDEWARTVADELQSRHVLAYGGRG
jgi:hypothetical protein